MLDLKQAIYFQLIPAPHYRRVIGQLNLLAEVNISAESMFANQVDIQEHAKQHIREQIHHEIYGELKREIHKLFYDFNMNCSSMIDYQRVLELEKKITELIPNVS